MYAVIQTGGKQYRVAEGDIVRVELLDKEPKESFEFDRVLLVDKNGELSVVVGKRFLVQLEGHGVDDVKTLHTVLDQTDLKKLASLK